MNGFEGILEPACLSVCVCQSTCGDIKSLLGTAHVLPSKLSFGYRFIKSVLSNNSSPHHPEF